MNYTIQKIGAACAVALTLLITACGSSSPRIVDPEKTIQAPHSIEHDGPYSGHVSGVVFPEQVSGIERVNLQAYDRDEYNISATYDSPNRVRITAYIYPAGQATSHRLSTQFLDAKQAVETEHPEVERVSVQVVTLPGGSPEVAGFEANWRQPNAVQRERLQLFECGQWFLKFRVTFMSGYTQQTEDAIRALTLALSCRGIAARHPVGPIKRVVVFPNMSEDEIVRWLVYGLSMIAWVDKHLSPKQRAFGIPDHEFELYFEALTRALKTHRARGGGTSLPTFDTLARIEQAGMLEEFVWSTYFNFLPPPSDLRLDLQKYNEWAREHLKDFRFVPRAFIASESPDSE